MKLFTIFVLLVTLAVADYDKEEHERNEYRQKHIPLDMRYLHLNKKQLSQAKKIIKQFRRDYKIYYHAKEASEKKVEKLFLKKTFDTKAFYQIVDKPNRYLLQMQSRFFSKMHQILTPKQRKRFTYYMEEWEVE